MYEDYSESKYGFAVKKSSKVTYKILLLSDSTFFKLFIHIFAAIIEALILMFALKDASLLFSEKDGY